MKRSNGPGSNPGCHAPARRTAAKRNRIAAVLAALLFAVAVCGAAEETPDRVVLREAASVTGPTVTLADVAELSGRNAEALGGIELAPAAAPGDARRLDGNFIAARIRTAGIVLDTVEISGASAVTAATTSAEITREMAETQLRRFLEDEMPWDPDNTLVDVAVPVDTMVVPDGSIEFQWWPDSRYRYLGNGTVRGNLLVDGRLKKSFLAKVAIETYGQVAVAADDIPRGQILGPGDFRLERRALSALRDPAFQDLDGLVGHVAKSAMFTGQVITKRYVEPRRLVKRNQLVSVEAVLGALRVQTQARALGDGAAGDAIACENLGSKDQFLGIVREDGTVVAQ